MSCKHTHLLNEVRNELTLLNELHCVKGVRIWSYSFQHFPVFRLNTERYGVSLRIQSEFGKMRTRITPNTDIFHAELTLLRDESQLFHQTP